MGIPIHILLVEDNPPDAAFIESRLLQAQLLKVGVETSGWLKSALMALTNKKFDLVLLDLGLPDSQGIDTLVEVLRVAPNVPVIVLSGREDLETAVLAVRAGAQSYIVKKQGLMPEMLEREIFYARERKNNDITSKKLTRASVSQVLMQTDEGRRSTPPPPLDAAMMGSQVAAVEDAVAKVRVHLMKNAPQQADAVEQILQHSNYYVAIREIRSVLKLDEEHGARTRRISDGALRAVRQASLLPEDQRGMELAEAREALLDAIGEEDSRG